MNRIIGKIGAAITGIAVLLFALSMIPGFFYKDYASCFYSIFIAIGFVPFMAAVSSVNHDGNSRAAGKAGEIFAAVYVVLVLIVYYAEITTVRMNGNLSDEILSVISYGKTGSLFFNYDLLGYAFMAISTFFYGLTVNPKSPADKSFKALLLIHGIFFIACLIIPMFPIFNESTGSLIGTVILELWCAYFLSVCILGYLYFNRRPEKK